MRILMVLPLCIALAGCGPSREELLNQASGECASYGAYHDSPQYTQCMMMKDQQIANNEMQRRANVQSAIGNMQRSIDASRPVQMAPRTCNSSVIGNQVQTNCY
jgi:hypothetical protein